MVKILDITPSMKIGGMANGLLQTIRHLDRDRYQFSIFTSYTDPPSVTEELQEMGVEIIKAPDHYASPLNYMRAFSKTLKDHGPFDIVHAHPYGTCGLFMMLAAWKGVPVRIAHAHNDHRTRDAAQKPHRKAYNAFMKGLIKRYATGGLGVSKNSAESLYGENWQNDPRWQVIYGGTDLESFKAKASQDILDLKKPDGPTVTLSGRLAHAKNPHFALKVFRELLKIEPNAKLLFIGDGELREALEKEVAQHKLQQNVIFAGMRNDVPALLHQYCDALLLPSFHEGLPRAAVEAQAAGLPVLISTNITRECDYTGRVEFLNLSDPPELWAKTLYKQLQAGKTPFEDAIAHALKSDFEVRNHAKKMAAFYEEQLKKAGAHAG